MENSGKLWYASKTLWFNILALAVAIAGVFGFGRYEMPEQWTEIIAVIVPAVGLVLRLITKEPLKRSR